MAMLNNSQTPYTEPSARRVRFCQATIIDTPEAYVFCGLGYRNRGRKHKLPYCECHLKKELNRRRHGQNKRIYNALGTARFLKNIKVPGLLSAGTIESGEFRRE